MRRFTLTLVICLTWLLSSQASAVLLYDKASRNLSTPGGVYADAGWQWEGQFGDYAGTVISKNLFLTARHIGGGVGDRITFEGKRYVTTAVFDDPDSDLRIYRIKGAFSTWAPLYTKGDETGKLLLAYGRGTQRGDEVTLEGTAKGWKWGPSDARLSWGRNFVLTTTEDQENLGSFIQWSFDRENGIKYEAALTRGDSGGGVFIKDGTKWKLAGVNYSADRFFATNQSEPFFEATMYDRGGFYVPNDEGGRQFLGNSPKDLPSISAASRISSNYDFISGVFNGTFLPNPNPQQYTGGTSAVPEPGAIALLSLAVGSALARRRRR